jgi:hypothetical protein
MRPPESADTSSRKGYRLNLKTRFTWTLCIFMAVAFGGCGGGGGGGGGGSETPGGGNTVPPADVSISGTITFDYIPAISEPSGRARLDYNAIESRAVRLISVQIIDGQNGSIVATTVTDDNGEYSVSVPPQTGIFLRVRAETINGGVPGWNVRVVDNTEQNALFVLDGSPFDSGVAGSVRNLHAGSGWTGSAYSEPRSAAPFAILDTVYDGMQFVLAAEPSLIFPPLVVHWSPNNNDSRGSDGQPDPSSGSIGLSFFSRRFGGIFLLGTENDDTEEYDRGVILHEWGHYIEDAFFRSDSIGGPHTLGDRLDMRVAFGEGFASALAGMILGDGLVIDTLGPRQSFGFTIDVENVSGLNSGWYSEESVQGILYDLFDTAQDTVQDQLAIGFGPMFDVLANEQRNSVALTSLFPFITGLKANRPGEQAQIDAIAAAQMIASITDDFGAGRTNPIPPSDADVLPIYSDIVVNGGPVSDICSTDDFGNSLIEIESVNKLGSRVFLKFSANITGTHTFQATATIIPPGAVSDPDMELHQRGLLLPFPEVDPPGKSGEANSETFTWPLTPGDYVLEVYEWTNTNARNDSEFPPIGRTCFDVEITTP